MFSRARTGSVVCRRCGRLVGVNDKTCLQCGARNPSLWGFAPALRSLGLEAGLPEIILFACAALYLASLAFDVSGIRFQGLRFLAPSTLSVVELGASGAVPVVLAGRWWTLLSAGWLHGDLLHIFFNLYWVRLLAPTTVELYGVGRTAVIYTLASVAGFAISTGSVFLPVFLQRIMGGGGGITLGASAALFGLLGALIYYGQRGGASALSRQVWGWALMLFLIGFLFPGVDNWAHLGGFGGGYLASRWLDPLTPERGDHLVWGLVCLLATAAAILASLLVPLPPELALRLGG